MSIALSIIDLASEQANKANATRIVAVELDIGTLSGVEIEALNFALDVAIRDSVLESAEIRINRIEAESECLECHHLFTPNGMFGSCPKCEGLNTRLIRGRELQIKSLLVD